MRSAAWQLAPWLALTLSALAPALHAEDPRALAREHFQNGVTAFENRRFAEAGREFESAYTLSPVFNVLYNIGQVNVALGRPVEAVDAFEKYLAGGGAAIRPDRRAHVEQEIALQKAHIGTITVRGLPDGAEVRVDGQLVAGGSTARPIRIAEGKHALAFVAKGHSSEVREIEVKPLTAVELEVKLQPNSPGPLVFGAPTPTAPAGTQQPVLSMNSAFPAFTPKTDSTPPATNAAPPTPATSAALGGAVRHNGWPQAALGYAGAGLGLVAIAIGSGLALTSLNQADDAASRGANARTGAQWDQAKQDFDSAQTRNLAGWITAGLGGAALAGGIVLAATARRSSPSSSVTLGLLFAMPGPTASDAGFVTARGTW